MIGKLGTLLMLLLVSASLFAQTGDISGRLTDNEKKEPLVGATVTLVGTRMGAVTDASRTATRCPTCPTAHTRFDSPTSATSPPSGAWWSLHRPRRWMLRWNRRPSRPVKLSSRC